MLLIPTVMELKIIMEAAHVTMLISGIMSANLIAV